MRLDEVVRELSLEVVACIEGAGAEVTGAYVSDLLSRAMAALRPGNIWVTVQAHPNVAAVGVLANVAGVVIAEGVRPEPATIERAQQEGLPLLSTPQTAFAVCAALARLGVGQPPRPRG